MALSVLITLYSGAASAHDCGSDTDVFSSITKYTLIPQWFADSTAAMFLPGAGACPVTVDFQSACRTHDACYSTQGNSKGDCDADFGDDLMALCDDYYIYRDILSGGLTAPCHTKCWEVAALMEEAVARLGDEAYNEAQGLPENWAWLIPILF